MGTSSSMGMPIRTSIATVIIAIFKDGIANIYHTDTGLTSTFHLGNSGSCHDTFLQEVQQDGIYIPSSSNYNNSTNIQM